MQSVHSEATNMGEQPAHQRPDSPRRRLKIYQEEVKLRHTSHWNWDYMSREELDRLASSRRGGDVRTNTDENAAPAARTFFAWAVAAAAAAGLVGTALAWSLRASGG